MDVKSAVLLLKVVADKVGAVGDLAVMARRVLDGEELTVSELDALRTDSHNIVTEWNEGLKTDIQDENGSDFCKGI